MEEQNQNNMASQNSTQPEMPTLAPNVAAALAYLFGFVSGIIFLLISKDKFVRFHAVQSIMLSVTAIVVNIAFSFIPRFWYAVSGLWSLVVMAAFIVMIVKAYQNQMFKLPVLGDIAEKYA